MPILYVEPQDFSVESPDEAVAIVARAQYVDWRAIRLMEPSSREYRTSVNALSRRLLDITKEVTEKQFNRELRRNLEDDDYGGIIDIMERVAGLLPDWLDVVMGEKINDAQLNATYRQFAAQIVKLRKARSPQSTVVAAQMRMAREMLPLLERTQKDARIYVAKSIQLDPLVSALARLVREHPGNSAIIIPLREAVNEAISEIQEKERREAMGWKQAAEVFDEMKHLGRIFQKCHAISVSAWREMEEGNNIVQRWGAELTTNPE
jgi:hypothetical protein